VTAVAGPTARAEPDGAAAGDPVAPPAAPRPEPAPRPAPAAVAVAGVRVRTWVAAATALAAGLTLWGLSSRPLWTDEAISIGAVNQLGATLRDTAGTMALYYVLLDAWSGVAGTSVVAVRALSVVFVVASVLGAGVLARRLLRPVEAVAAVVLVAALPALARTGQEARSYALTMLLATVGWLCLARAVDAGAGTAAHLDRRARTALLALVPVAVAGVLAHGLFVVQVAALVLSCTVLPRRRPLLAWMALPAGAALATAGALFVAGAGGVADWILPLSRQHAIDVAATVFGPNLITACVLGLLGARGAARLLARRGDGPAQRWRALVPVWWALAPAAILVAVSVVRPYLVGRYLLASVPALGMLAAVGAVAVVEAAAPADERRRRRLAGALVVVLVASAVLLGRLTAAQINTEDWDGAAEVVADGSRAGDGILFTPSSGTIPFSVRTPFEAAWRDAGRADRAPDPVATGVPLGTVRRFYPMPERADVAPELPGHQRLWIVHKIRGGGVGDAALEDVLAWPELRHGYRVARRELVRGGIQVLLLERR